MLYKHTIYTLTSYYHTIYLFIYLFILYPILKEKTFLNSNEFNKYGLNLSAFIVLFFGCLIRLNGMVLIKHTRYRLFYRVFYWYIWMTDKNNLFEKLQKRNIKGYFRSFTSTFELIIND